MCIVYHKKIEKDISFSIFWNYFLLNQQSDHFTVALSMLSSPVVPANKLNIAFTANTIKKMATA